MAEGRDIDWTLHTRTLPADARDVEGRLLPAGIQVICNTQFAPGEFLEDTAGNRQKFAELGGAWTGPTRQKVFLIPPSAYAAELSARVGRAAGALKEFAAAIEENMHSLVGQPFPRPKVPAHYHLIPFEWEPTVRQAISTADLTGQVICRAVVGGGIPADLPLPAPVKEVLSRLFSVRVFEIGRSDAIVHVVAAFAVSIKFAPGREPLVSALDHSVQDIIMAAYDSWLGSTHWSRPILTVFTFGTFEEPEGSVVPTAGKDRWTLISFPKAAGFSQSSSPWETRLPLRFGERLAMRYFLDTVKPETEMARFSRIKKGIDELLIVYPGHLTVARVADQTKTRKSVVADTFYLLQNQAADCYHIYKSDGQLAIRKAKPGEKIGLGRPARWRAAIRRHALGLFGVAVGAVAWRVRGWLQMSGTTGVTLALVCGYIGNQVQTYMHNRAEISKE